MTPWEDILEIHDILDELVDKYPLDASGMMAWHEAEVALKKLECAYNRLELNKENDHGNT